jgi:hypothetical protein
LNIYNSVLKKFLQKFTIGVGVGVGGKYILDGFVATSEKSFGLIVRLPVKSFVDYPS